MTGLRWALAGVVVALIAVFTAISVSLVHARRPLDSAVGRSFAAVAPGIGARAATVSPLGCQKATYDFYNCRIAVRSRGRHHFPGVVLRYRLSLTEDGCWTAQPQPLESVGLIPPQLRTPFVRPQGCTAGARRKVSA